MRAVAMDLPVARIHMMVRHSDGHHERVQGKFLTSRPDAAVYALIEMSYRAHLWIRNGEVWMVHV